MFRLASGLLTVLAFADLVAADPRGQTSSPRGTQEARGSQETRGSHESRATPRAHVPSSGLTLELMNGLPPTRRCYPSRGPVYQPYYYQPYPSYPFNSAYSYPHPYGLGGYYLPMAGGYVYGGWGWGWWFW